MFDAEEVLTAATLLLNVPGASVAKPAEAVEYFYMMLDQHELIFANGMIAATMLAGKCAIAPLSVAARQELMSVFPDLNDIVSERVTARPLARAARTR